MQKLFDRMGTEQHKYRLALQFTSIFIGSHGYVPQGTCYRIVLQRGSKKYSSNYLNVALNCEQPINETIQVKATMFFETARQQYQEKKFDIVIMRKDILGETTIAKFAFMAQNCLRFRGESATYRDTLNKLQANIFCEHVDGDGINCNTSVSDRSSIDRSIETRRRRDNSYQRESIPSISHMLMPQMQPNYNSGLSARHNDYQQHPNEQIRKSIVEQFKLDYGGPSMNQEQFRGSQLRTNQHMGPIAETPSSFIHYNHPQQGGYHNSTKPQQEYATKLSPPSPAKTLVNPMQSPQSALNDPTMNREVQKMFQMGNYTPPPNNPRYQNNGASQLSYNSNQQSQLRQQPQNSQLTANPFVQMSSRLIEQSSPYQLQPILVTPPEKYTSQPVLEVLRDNLKMQLNNSQQTKNQLTVEKAEYKLAAAFASKPVELPIEIGLVTNVPMQQIPSLKSSKPILQDLQKKTVLSTFKDVMNTSSQRGPVQRKISKKESSKLTENRQYLQPTLEQKLNSPAPQIIIGPDITAVDSQIVDGPSSKFYVLQPNPMIASKSQLQPTNPAKESYMSASFKMNNVQDRLNSSFESPKFMLNDSQDHHKREDILKEQLEREREKYRQDLNLRKQLQLEKDRAFDNEIRFLNQQMQTQTKKYRSEIAMRQEFIAQKQQIVERLNSEVETARCTNNQLVSEVERLTTFNIELQKSSDAQKLKIEELTQEQLKIKIIYDKLETDYEVLSSQHNLLKCQYDQLCAQHNQMQANHNQASAEYRRLLDSHADLGEHKQNLAQINKDVKDKLDQTLIQLDALTQAKDAMAGENISLASQITALIKQIEQLQSSNMSLQTEVNSLRCQVADAGNLTKQVEWINIANRNSIGQMEELRAEKQLLARKQNDIVQKYIKNFNDLNAERIEKEQLQTTVTELENKLRDYPGQIRKRNEEIVLLHNQIKSMEFTMVNPQEDPTYLNMQNQVQTQSQQIATLKQQYFLEISNKQKQIEHLNDKLNKTQNLLNETVSIWTLKEKSLTEVMTAKDRRMAELEKQSDKSSSKSEITVKYAHADQDKRKLILKIESLQSQIERLQELDDQIAVVESINKDLEARVKLLINENSKYRAENQSLLQRIKSANNSKVNEDLQQQLTKANTIISDIVQHVFHKNPSLGQELARMKV